MSTLADTATSLVVEGIGDLERLAKLHGTDKFEHGYCPAYENHFRHLRHEPITLLEIGVWKGASLHMWHDFFPEATIIGIDIAPLATVNSDRVTTVTGDVKEYEPEEHFDIVIDDGSHDGADMVAALNRLWPFVKLGGWYVIEDLQTQFSVQWGGGRRSPALAKLKTGLLELLHDQPECPLAEIHVYPQLCFIRKVAA